MVERYARVILLHKRWWVSAILPEPYHCTVQAPEVIDRMGSDSGAHHDCFLLSALLSVREVFPAASGSTQGKKGLKGAEKASLSWPLTPALQNQ